jgi:hypothetical protein
MLVPWLSFQSFKSLSIRTQHAQRRIEREECLILSGSNRFFEDINSELVLRGFIGYFLSPGPRVYLSLFRILGPGDLVVVTVWKKNEKDSSVYNFHTDRERQG